jgi:Bacteriophage clamp loader A subunit
MADLIDFLKSVNQNKLNILVDDPSAEKDYPPFVVNRLLSYFTDSIMYVNEINFRPLVDKRLQYEYLLHALKPRPRFSKWLKPEAIENLDVVKEYYGFSNEKAKQALKILSDQDIEYIKAKLDKGGLKRSEKSKT